ncbi:MAG TPA: ATP-binding protein [Pyrinomonadaceae bacterium]|nr:ATP-binding protein [Pyrinomonadaceae bacterium]
MKAGSALLFRQLILITLLVGAVALVLISINTEQLSRSLIARTRDQAEAVAVQTANVVEAALVDAPDKKPQDAIRESQPLREFAENIRKRDPTINSLIIVDSESAILLEAPAGAGTRAQNSLEDRLRFPTSLSLLKSSDSRYDYFRALDYRGKPLGGVRLGVSLSAVRDEVKQSLVINLLIALAAVAAATFIAISSARLITAPLRAISSTIERIEQSDARFAESNAPAQASDPDIERVADRIEQISRQIAGDRTELRETRGRLHQILSNLQVRLLLVNADERVMLASPGVEETLGVDKINEGQQLAEVLGAGHPLTLQTHLALSSHLASNTIAPASVDGAGYTFTVQPISDRGETVGALITLHDRATVAKLESQLNYSERLADFARITSGIAHEVKNPLNAMVIHLELLRAKLERLTPLAEEARPQLDILTSEIQRLDRVVQTFLNFTRPPRVQFRSLDLNRLLEETLQLAAPEAEAHGAKIERVFATDLPKIAGDGDLLKQAFLNIIINGLQAMEHGGRLRVATGIEDERTVLVSVTDHGAGIPDEARARIFHLYFTTKRDGHGIGLAQAFRAVQLHDGQIAFDSAPNQGTTFYLRFQKQ